MQKNHFYLIEIQYLGFRYHGWQRQPGVKTVQEMIERTLKYILADKPFKILGASRTDAMVSATQAAFELFLQEPEDPSLLLAAFNENLPADIRATDIQEVDATFNVIQHAKQKEYLYLFSFGEKNHPFAAPYITYIREELDVELMKEGARLFLGKHNFSEYCYKPNEGTVFEREILESEIVANDIWTANFFPTQSFLYRVKGMGFMRNQIRLFMGRLFRLGKHEITLQDIEQSLTSPSESPTYYIAPASGLMLHQMAFK
ncbi:tRNA pseudouridine(38-40) synthase TruA [Reichenbachiella carrageenanivorans]|uniref:tRNA pseudouridine synthase A n=1 Tax=Reichenbachiella carrageenanivorans TaxID=2979869 RepID=A0ABY6CXE5_9BACT|nr:tRNA pseudouridine(38-40) synthase TruA [Reichenbachiella carrageenanivorans]UXX78572.1 tRNA pseudouridine(38-40) synthase TruA [Reichenbachiella carrageenanivorans]